MRWIPKRMCTQNIMNSWWIHVTLPLMMYQRSSQSGEAFVFGVCCLSVRWISSSCFDRMLQRHTNGSLSIRRVLSESPTQRPRGRPLMFLWCMCWASVAFSPLHARRYEAYASNITLITHASSFTVVNEAATSR